MDRYPIGHLVWWDLVYWCGFVFVLCMFRFVNKGWLYSDGMWNNGFGSMYVEVFKCRFQKCITSFTMSLFGNKYKSISVERDSYWYILLQQYCLIYYEHLVSEVNVSENMVLFPSLLLHQTTILNKPQKTLRVYHILTTFPKTFYCKTYRFISIWRLQLNYAKKPY